MLSEHNPYIRDFKAIAQWREWWNKGFLCRNTCWQNPVGQHSDCYNASTTNEIAFVLVDQDPKSRDIVRGKGNCVGLLYDCLQYPVIIVYGGDSYRMAICKWAQKLVHYWIRQ